MRGRGGKTGATPWERATMPGVEAGAAEMVQGLGLVRRRVAALLLERSERGPGDRRPANPQGAWTRAAAAAEAASKSGRAARSESSKAGPGYMPMKRMPTRSTAASPQSTGWTR